MMSAMETETHPGDAAVKFRDFRSRFGPCSGGEENNEESGIGILESRKKVRGTPKRETATPSMPHLDCLSSAGQFGLFF
jgi:hypothetical protein